ncbi:MAG: photosynthetic reaction center cytochrome PufC [Hyphomicrobiales bacterium]
MRQVLGAAAAIVAVLALLVLPGWEAPPMKSTQLGYRGTGMDIVQNPRTLAKLLDANVVPEAQPPADLSGKKASEVYKNVQVLGDLDEGQFNRLMAAITEWVSPEEGCTYCHNTDNMADDSLYTKKVARRMLQMTGNINANWQKHVAQTGVTCYTCHRGNPVPKNVWYQGPDTGPTAGMLGYTGGQDGVSVADTSLPHDPFTPLLNSDANIRVEGPEALPVPTHNVSLQTTETTYSLMMHMSKALGVNCTFCHNTRSIASWPASTPQRVTAWYGIRLARDVNGKYLEGLKDVFPPNRLGPHGDVAKVNCATCHQGLNKPLNGVSMLKDYAAELGSIKQQ